MSKAVIFGSSEELVGGEMEESSLVDQDGQNSASVQSMPNEQIRKQLQTIYSTLQEAVQTIDPISKTVRSLNTRSVSISIKQCLDLAVFLGSFGCDAQPGDSLQISRS